MAAAQNTLGVQRAEIAYFGSVRKGQPLERGAAGPDGSRRRFWLCKGNAVPTQQRQLALLMVRPGPRSSLHQWILQTAADASQGALLALNCIILHCKSTAKMRKEKYLM